MAKHGGLPIVVAGLLAFGLAAWLSVFVGSLRVADRRGRPPIRRRRDSGWRRVSGWRPSGFARGSARNFPWVLLGSSQAIVAAGGATRERDRRLRSVGARRSRSARSVAILTLSRNRAQRRTAALAALGLALDAGLGRMARVAERPPDAGHADARRARARQRRRRSRNGTRRFAQRSSIATSRSAAQAIGAGAQLVLWPEASTPFYFDIDANLAEPIRRLARESQHARSRRHRRVSKRPASAGADRFFNARGARWTRRQNARLVSEDSARAVWRVRAVQAPAVFRRAACRECGRLHAWIASPRFSTPRARGSASPSATKSIYAGLAREFVNNGAQLLTTITNDAWFGRIVGRVSALRAGRAPGGRAGQVSRARRQHRHQRRGSIPTGACLRDTVSFERSRPRLTCGCCRAARSTTGLAIRRLPGVRRSRGRCAVGAPPIVRAAHAAGIMNTMTLDEQVRAYTDLTARAADVRRGL